MDPRLFLFPPRSDLGADESEVFLGRDGPVGPHTQGAIKRAHPLDVLVPRLQNAPAFLHGCIEKLGPPRKGACPWESGEEEEEYALEGEEQSQEPTG